MCMKEMYGQDCGKIVAYEPTSLFFRFRKIGVMGTTMCLVKVTLVTKITFNGKMERLRKLFFRVSCGTSRKLLGRAHYLIVFVYKCIKAFGDTTC